MGPGERANGDREEAEGAEESRALAVSARKKRVRDRGQNDEFLIERCNVEEHTHTCAREQIHTRTRTRTYTRTMCAHTRTRIHVHMYTRTRTHTFTSICTHTHTHAHQPPTGVLDASKTSDTASTQIYLRRRLQLFVLASRCLLFVKAFLS